MPSRQLVLVMVCSSVLRRVLPGSAGMPVGRGRQNSRRVDRTSAGHRRAGRSALRGDSSSLCTTSGCGRFAWLGGGCWSSLSWLPPLAAGQVAAIGSPAEIAGIDHDDARVAGTLGFHFVRSAKVRQRESVGPYAEAQVALDVGVADADKAGGGVGRVAEAS